MATVLPFVQEWGLPLNPEDVAEIVYAVLAHARSERTFDEIDRDVRKQLQASKDNTGKL